MRPLTQIQTLTSAEWPAMSKGFTLIELLVVITVIVVLLALLTPALDRSIYQAELAACGANLKGVASGVQVYAAANKRYYPNNKSLDAGANTQPFNLNESGSNNPGRDSRLHVRDYFSLDMLVDPLCESVSLEPDGNHNSMLAYSSYNLWYGWGFAGFSKMRRMGDRFAWAGTDREGNEVAARFPYLITDRDFSTIDDNMVNNSHPDEDGVMSNIALDNEYDRSLDRPAVLVALTQFNRQSISLWISWSAYERGEVEQNSAYDDGSVARTNDVKWEHDERTIPVPENWQVSSWPNKFNQLVKP